MRRSAEVSGSRLSMRSPKGSVADVKDTLWAAYSSEARCWERIADEADLPAMGFAVGGVGFTIDGGRSGGSGGGSGGGYSIGSGCSIGSGGSSGGEGGSGGGGGEGVEGDKYTTALGLWLPLNARLGGAGSGGGSG